MRHNMCALNSPETGSFQLIAINDIKLAGAPFDAAMDALIGARDPEVEFTFFRGSTEDLKRAVGECCVSLLIFLSVGHPREQSVEVEDLPPNLSYVLVAQV